MKARAAILLSALAGCGATGRPVDYEDDAAVRSAFIAVVQECYRGRQDGILREPAIDPNRIRFVFQYDKMVDGAMMQWIDLTFARLPNGAHSRPVFRVLVSEPLRGPNRVLRDQTARLEGMLRERLKA